MASLFPDLRTTAALIACFAAAGAAPGVHAQSAISDAEQRLFMDVHLANLPDKAAVSYDYAKTGTLEPAFEDQVRLEVDKTAAGRHTHVDYLTGKYAFALPDIESANGNPVILCFLERDVREMERRTGGKANYFRRRVRLALAENAQVEPVDLDLQGRPVEAVRISIRPLRERPDAGALPGLRRQGLHLHDIQGGPRNGVRDAHRGARPNARRRHAPPLVVERLVYAGTKP